MSEFLELEAWAQGIVAAVGPAGRQRLAQRLARDLRRSQAARIAAQENPDGSRFEPRKAQAAEHVRFRARTHGIRDRHGAIRRRAEARKATEPMFRKLRTSAWLRAGVDQEGVWAGFTGRGAAIAMVHQEGLVDRTSPRGPEVRYPVRLLLGFTEAEKAAVLEALAQHLVL